MPNLNHYNYALADKNGNLVAVELYSKDDVAAIAKRLCRGAVYFGKWRKASGGGEAAALYANADTANRDRAGRIARSLVMLYAVRKPRYPQFGAR